MDKHIEQIYHYCSLDTFLAIIKNKTLRFTDYRKVNDVTELRHIYLIALDLINSMCGFGRFETNHSESYIDAFTAYPDGATREYICCLSKSNEILSQWRCYADNCKGVCIGFNKRIVEKSIQDTSIRMCDIIYDLDAQQKMIKDKITKISPASSSDPLDILSRLRLNGEEYKNDVFREEQEVRLIFNEDSLKPYVEQERLGLWSYSKKDFCIKSDSIVSYFDMCFEKIPDIITSITIGPLAQVDYIDIASFFYDNITNSNDIDINKYPAPYKT